MTTTERKSNAIPDWFHDSVMYVIYAPSFYDSNGDGIGDITGIIEKLDYIKELGCNLIWLGGSLQSSFRDCGYDVTDYYRVADRYGTNEDMRRLFREAKARGIRILMDLIIGHTSIDHPWFQESSKPEENKYSHWYIWTDDWLCFARESDTRLVSGYSDRNGCFAINFFQSQPALNHGFLERSAEWQLPVDHPSVRDLREEIKRIMRHWLDMGASGFRADMASSLVRNDPTGAGNTALWRELRGMLDAEYPDAVLLAEWGDPSASVPAGFHGDFLSPHIHPVDTSLFRAEPERNILQAMTGVDHGSYFDRAGDGDLSLFLGLYRKYLEDIRNQGYVVLGTGNFDFTRLSIGRTMDDMEVIFAFLMTMPGIPMVYYGEEIGMAHQTDLVSKEGGYTRTGARTPMQWSTEQNAGFSAATTEDLFLPVDTSPNAPSVATQETSPDSLLSRVRRFIQLRRATPALGAAAEFTVLSDKNRGYPFVYRRVHGDEKVVVVINPSATSYDTEVEMGQSVGLAPMVCRGVTPRSSGDTITFHIEGASYGIFAEHHAE